LTVPAIRKVATIEKMVATSNTLLSYLFRVMAGNLARMVSPGML
jgi:hypothetical protein